MDQAIISAKIHSLRERMTALARSLRKSTIAENMDLSDPVSNLDDEIIIDGQTLKRKRIVLLTRGCTVASCTMCPLPNEAIDPKMRCIKDQNIIDQFDRSFIGKNISDYEVVTIYTNGNFFVDQEVAPAVRRYMYDRVRGGGIKMIIVESLPQFITDDIIKEAISHLGQVRLSVSIGLQSYNDLVRELAVNSSATRPDFEAALQRLKDAGYCSTAFLMVKPPFLTEKEAAEETVESVIYLNRLGILDPVLCATKVGANTVVNILAEEGKYSPPWLWTVIDILRRIKKIVPDSVPVVATSLLDRERNADFHCSQNCEKCTPKILRELQIYNMTRDPSPLMAIECACRKDYEAMAEKEQSAIGSQSLLERIEKFLDVHQPA